MHNVRTPIIIYTRITINIRINFEANGTTGEGMTMSVKERQEVAEAWSDAAKKNSQHLVVQVGGAPIADVKELVGT